jgi:hypothetical protein
MARRLVLLLSLLLSAPFAVADSLYTGQVPVASQSEQDLATGLSAALGQVLVRLSGENTLLNRPGVAKAIAQPNRYVQQYQYVQDVVPDSRPPLVRLSLVAQFDRAAVDQLLVDLGLARTGSDAAPAAVVDMRPQTFHLWVSGVNSADDYARVVGMLARNELVRSVQAESARNDGVGLRIEITGALPRLLESLGSGPVRVLNAAPPVEGVDALLGVQP